MRWHFLEFSGELNDSIAEVYYPIPYESPPHLLFPGADQGYLRDLEQKAEGFSVITFDLNAPGEVLKWEAVGVPKQNNHQK